MMKRMTVQQSQAQDELFIQTGVEEWQLQKAIKELKMMENDKDFKEAVKVATTR